MNNWMNEIDNGWMGEWTGEWGGEYVDRWVNWWMDNGEMVPDMTRWFDDYLWYIQMGQWNREKK